MTKEKSSIIYAGFSHLTPPTEFLDPKMKKFERYTCNICGHEQIVEVKSVFEGNFECNVCNFKEAMADYNTLNITNPKEINNWNYINNYLLTNPNNILSEDINEVWWTCEKCNNNYLKTTRKKLLNSKRKITNCIFCNGMRYKKFHFLHY